MCNQLRVAFFKLCHFRVLIIAAVCMAAFGFPYGYVKLAGMEEGIYGAFRETICDTSFLFLGALVSAWFVGNDFGSRTIHHEISLGYSRGAVLAVRELPVFLAAVILHFTYIISSMLGAAGKAGFSGSIFTAWDLLWCAVIILQLMAIQSIIVLITIVCAKAASAIAASICFTFVMCNVLRNFFDGRIYTSSCFCLVRDNRYETLFPAGLAAAFILIVTITLTYLVFRKKEIK